MRIKFSIFVISMLALIGLASCEDVINSDPNYKKKYSDSSNIRNDIYFRFWADDLNYNLQDTTKLFETTKPSSWGLNLYVVNNTFDSNFVLKSVKLDKGNYFNLWSISQLPYELEPFKTNSNKSFVITLVVDTLEYGTYIDRIIVNNDPELSFYVRVKVK